MSIKFKWALAFLVLIALTLGIEWLILHAWLKQDLEKQLAPSQVGPTLRLVGHALAETMVFAYAIGIILSFGVSSELMRPIRELETVVEHQFGQIRGEKTTLQALLASMIDGLIVLDDQKRIKFLNPQ